MDNLAALPDVSFVETDAQRVINDIISGYEQTAGRVLAQADPVRLFLLSLAYVIIQQRQMIDAAGKSNLLRYAKGPFLDNLGAARRTPRRSAERAKTVQRFTLSAAQAGAIGIPAGTRVTHDQNLYWRTTQPAEVPAGQLFVDVPIEAMTAGSGANGLPVGAINQLVDPIAYVASVTNTGAAQGGLDVEDDESYRARIYDAPAAFSTAGPSEAYEYFAYLANAAISHVRADMPEPGTARVCVLLAGGALPDSAILQAVEAELRPSDRRPLCDNVLAIAPEPVEYELEFTYYVRRQDQASQPQIDARVRAAAADYAAWQRAQIGRDINPDELVTRVKAAGAKRLAIESPGFEVITATQVAQDVVINVIYGGVEDE